MFCFITWKITACSGFVQVSYIRRRLCNNTHSLCQGQYTYNSIRQSRGQCIYGCTCVHIAMYSPAVYGTHVLVRHATSYRMAVVRVRHDTPRLRAEKTIITQTGMFCCTPLARWRIKLCWMRQTVQHWHIDTTCAHSRVQTQTRPNSRCAQPCDTQHRRSNTTTTY